MGENRTHHTPLLCPRNTPSNCKLSADHSYNIYNKEIGKFNDIGIQHVNE